MADIDSLIASALGPAVLDGTAGPSIPAEIASVLGPASLEASGIQEISASIASVAAPGRSDASLEAISLLDASMASKAGPATLEASGTYINYNCALVNVCDEEETIIMAIHGCGTGQCMPGVYDVGQAVLLEGIWVNPDGLLIDPDQVKLAITDPDGLVEERVYPSGIGKESQGRYKATVVASKKGQWFYRWYSEGRGAAARQRSFFINEAVDKV